LAFAPLGPDFAAAGAAAGLTGAIVTGIVVGLVATSSFIIASPRVSESLLLASLIVMLSKRPDIANDKALIVIAVFSCVLLGGLFQAIFGLAGVAKIIKFTPHPVLVGFLNGIAVLVAVSQLKPYFLINPASSNVALIDEPSMFLLMVGVAILMLFFPMVAKRFPARWALGKTPPVLVGFIGGIGAFYFIKALDPGLFWAPS
jgi:sulfate permease, SulP family